MDSYLEEVLEILRSYKSNTGKRVSYLRGALTVPGNEGRSKILRGWMKDIQSGMEIASPNAKPKKKKFQF